MFTKEQTLTMRPVLGRKYTADVLSILAANGVTSRNNEPYGPEYVRTIFNGESGNLVIEAAILEVYAKRKAEIDAFEKKRNQLLNTELA